MNACDYLMQQGVLLFRLPRVEEIGRGGCLSQREVKEHQDPRKRGNAMREKSANWSRSEQESGASRGV